MKNLLKKYLSRASEATDHVHDSSASPDGSGSGYPLEDLACYIGQTLEVHYLDMDSPQIETSRLLARPSASGFYLSSADSEMHITYWHNRHTDGRISGVKLIMHKGTVLYRDDRLPFDYESAREREPHLPQRGPVRKRTREYLSGAFG